ncbi:hypothetical protein NC652_036498 [Populus alba x Populus x berolinensis]|nr:hypothetical protein NC652_036498 [Populus alba x Populus x berolinensis]
MDHHHQPANQKHHLLYLPLVIKRELVYAIAFLIVVASSFFVFDLIGSFDPRSVFRFGFIKNDKDSSQSAACDYSRGRWFGMKVTRIYLTLKAAPFLIQAFGAFKTEEKDADYRNWRRHPEGTLDGFLLWEKQELFITGVTTLRTGGKVNMSLNVMEAFQKSLQTWKSWGANLSHEGTRVFFRGYSPVHYRNGTWDEGGRCDVEYTTRGKLHDAGT